MLRAKKAKSTAYKADAVGKKTWRGKTKKVKQSNGTKFDPEDPTLPPLFTKCVAYLEEKALDVEGIFRVSGSVARVKALKERFDKGENVNMEEIVEPHCVSGCLKLFLRELTDPVCTFELYDCFLAAASVAVRQSRVSCLRKVIELLPPGNYNLLRDFCSLLKKIHDQAEINMMKASNLSIVFSPTLLRAKDENEESMMTDMNVSNMLVEQFIIDFEEVFMGKEVEEEILDAPPQLDAGPPQDIEVGGPPEYDAPPPALTPRGGDDDASFDPLSQSGPVAPPTNAVPNKFRRTTTGGASLAKQVGPPPTAPVPTALPPPPASPSSSSSLSSSGGLPRGQTPAAKAQARRKAMILTGDIKQQLSMHQPEDGESEESAAQSEESQEAARAGPPERTKPPEIKVKPIMYARGLWDFEAELADELSFTAGTPVAVLKLQGDKEGFWFGEYFTNPADATDTTAVADSIHTVRTFGWFQSDYVEETGSPEQTAAEAVTEEPADSSVGQGQENEIIRENEEEEDYQADENNQEDEDEGDYVGDGQKAEQWDGKHEEQYEEQALENQEQSQEEHHEKDGEAQGENSPSQHAEPAPSEKTEQIEGAASPSSASSTAPSSAAAGAQSSTNGPSTQVQRLLVCRAKWDFVPPADKPSLLAFKRGDAIVVRKKGKEGGWWLGQLNGKIGHFPVAYTDEIVVARQQSGANLDPSRASTGTAANQEFDRILMLAKQHQRKSTTNVAQEDIAAAGKELQQEEQEEQEAQAEEASSSVTANEEEETAEEDREEEEGEEGDNGENEAEEWVVSVYEYTKTPDTPEHSFDIGQKMKVVRRFPGGWLEAELDGVKGFVPGTYVESCDAPQ